jgi:mRNA-degrading endonuclease toxin of MazEF toxin-antitoxin module
LLTQSREYVCIQNKKTGLAHDSKAQAHQVRTISKQRINSAVKGSIDITTSKQRINSAVKGSVDITTMQRVEAALKIHLDFIVNVEH